MSTGHLIAIHGTLSVCTRGATSLPSTVRSRADTTASWYHQTCTSVHPRTHRTLSSVQATQSVISTAASIALAHPASTRALPRARALLHVRSRPPRPAAASAAPESPALRQVRLIAPQTSRLVVVPGPDDPHAEDTTNQ
eukprot:2284074-Rhodomonas_salina.1